MALEISLMGSENTDIHGGTFNGGWRLQQNPAELAWMIKKMWGIRRFNLYGEIGLGSGGTMRAVQRLTYTPYGIGIDDGKQPYSKYVRDNLEFSGVPNTWIKGDSHSDQVKQELDELVNELRFTFDAILIDGDHSFAGVTQDVELVRQYCREDTLLFFHDIALVNWPGCSVPRFWRESKLITRVDEFVAPPSKSGHQMGIGMAVLA